MKRLILLFLLLPIISALEVNVDCPSKVQFNSEFECSINIPDNKIDYDVKIYIKTESGGINKIWVGENWQRADWYFKKGVTEEENKIKIIIHKEFYGDAFAEIKLRNSETQKVEYSEEVEIEIIKEANIKSEKTEEPPEEIITTKAIETKIELQKEVQKEEIVLNPKDIKTKNHLIELFQNNIMWILLVILGIFVGLMLLKKENKNEFRKHKEHTLSINN
jgi:hypothetical protein